MGGYLTDEFGWRSIFNVNLPLGLFAFFVGLAVIRNPDHAKRPEGEPRPKLDAMGLGLLVAGIGCLQYVLERGEADDWFSSKAIVVNLIIAIVCLPTFVWWELKVENPIINIRLFKQSIVRNGTLLMMFVGFFLYSVVFLLPVFVGRVFHYDATQTGALFIPGSLLTMALMPMIGKLMQAGKNPKILILIGFLSIELCLYMMTLFSPLTSKSELYMMLFVRGFALAFLFVPINSSILSQFQGAALGQVSGLLNLFRQIGGSVGIALVGTLLNSRSHQNYLDLTSKVSMLNPNTQAFVNQTSQGLSKKMVDEMGRASGYEATLQILYYKIQNQVFMMSFLQLITVIMILFSLAFIPLYLLRLREKPVLVTDAH